MIGSEELRVALSTEQVQLFLSQGFVVCESFFSERETAALATEIFIKKISTYENMGHCKEKKSNFCEDYE